MDYGLAEFRYILASSKKSKVKAWGEEFGSKRINRL